jgi:hypothetical protein
MDTRIDPPKSSEGVCHACEIDPLVEHALDKLREMTIEQGIYGLIDIGAAHEKVESWLRESLPNVICAECAEEMGV